VLFNLSLRTIRRWSKDKDCIGDARRGPKKKPKSTLSKAERKKILKVMNSPEYRDETPNKIVPKLADKGEYLASERTMYRILKQEGLLTHRQKSKIPSNTKPEPLAADGPNQVWSWDISYLKLTRRGSFIYLYLIEDIWSRKIVGWQVHEEESASMAALLIEDAFLNQHLVQQGVPRTVATSYMLSPDEEGKGPALIITALENNTYHTRRAQDMGGQTLWVQNALGHKTRMGYDALGRLVGEWAPHSSPARAARAAEPCRRRKLSADPYLSSRWDGEGDPRSACRLDAPPLGDNLLCQ
jgi:YD repeat-containing protein